MGCSVPEFDIDLDQSGEDRFVNVIKHFQPALDKLYNGLVDNPLVLAISKKIAAHRGDENPELMAELRGIAATVGWPLHIVQSAQVPHLIQANSDGTLADPL